MAPNAGANIATAYITLVPSMQGTQGSIANQLGQEGSDSGESFLGSFKGKAMAGIAGVAVAVGAAFADAYSEAVENRKSEAKLRASLGLDSDAAREMGKVAGQLYANGYGESISELTTTVGEVFSSIKGLDIQDTGQLQKLTGQAISFAEAFDTDVSTAVQSVGTLMNSGLVKDANQAFDLITRASQKVPAALRGDVLDASDEYSQFFRTLGFSGEQAFDVLVKGSEKGTFGIDKAGDAIKEFTIRSTDMSKSSVEAYQAIGLNADEMANSILAGGDTANGAFQKIVDGVLGIQDPATQANTAIALFGTQMEDLNVGDVPDFLQSLKGMSGGLGEVEGAASDMDAAMGSTSSSIDLFWRGIKTKMVDYITDNVLPAVTKFTAWLGETLGPYVQMAADWISTTLVPAIQELVAWLVEKFGPAVEKAGAFIRDSLIPFLKDAWTWFEQNLLPTVQRFGEFFQSTFENIATVLGGIIDFVAGVFTGDWSRVWEGVKAIFSGIWDQIKNVISTAFDVVTEVGGKILDWLSGLPGWAYDRLKAFAGFLTEKGSEFLNWILDGIKTKGEELFNWFGSLPGKAWDRVKEFGSWVLDRGKEFIGWIGSGIDQGFQNMLDWFKALPGKIWDALVGLKDKVLQIGKEFVGWIVEGVKSVAGDIWSAITDAFTVQAESFQDNAFAFAVGSGADGGHVSMGGGRLQVRAGGGIMDFLQAEQDYGRKWVSPTGKIAGPGGPRSDVIPTWLSDGEYVNNAYSTSRWGDTLEWLNLGKPDKAAWSLLPYMFSGGPVPAFANGGALAARDLAHTNATIFGKNLALALKDKTIEEIKNSQVGSNGNWGPGTDGSGLAANTAAAKAFIERTFSGVSSIGGVYGGSVPGSDHPIGKALDVMIANYLSQAGITAGTKIADWFVQNPNSFGTKYVIWRDRINQGGTWAPYQHPSGSNDTLQHRDHVHLSFLTGDGQFQAGSVAADDRPTGLFGRLVAGLAGTVQGKLGLSTSVPAGVEGGQFPPLVERWRSLGLDVLSKVGAYKGLSLTQYIGQMLNQVRTESGGDPNAINLYDINAQRGDPSIGLLQVIGSTFRNALAGTPFANLIGLGQRDPRASLTASTLYSLSRYGSLPAAWRGVAYDNGGWLMPGFTPTVNMLNRPEAVLTPPQSDALVSHAEALQQGWAGAVPSIQVFIGDTELEDIVGYTVNGKFVDLTRAVNVAAGSRS